MSSPCPVTSATTTDRATGLAERIVVPNVPPAAVVIPNGTPPSASGRVAIQSVSGFPSPSTSRVGLVAAPDGWVALVAVHPAGEEDDDGADDEDDDAAEDDDVPDADESPDDAHPATTSGASRPTARRGKRMGARCSAGWRGAIKRAGQLRRYARVAI